MRPSLSSADECTVVHVWAQSSLPGCVCAKVNFIFYFFGWKKAYMSMPILSATRKADKANHRRVAGPQHIL